MMRGMKSLNCKYYYGYFTTLYMGRYFAADFHLPMP